MDTPRVGKHSERRTRRHQAGRVVAGLFYAGAGALLVSTLTSPPAQADINWAPLIACESGGRPTATNPSSTASGLFQFLDTSWRAYGGGKYAARAKDATPAQQYEIANHAYAMSGLNPWAASRGCWGGKVSTTAKPAATPVSAPVHTGAVTTYTVQLGDTLNNIAGAHGTGWEQLYAMNRGVVSDPNLILPGQSLKMPA
jgi:resuscitation-promoting factor RpfA